MAWGWLYCEILLWSKLRLRCSSHSIDDFGVFLVHLQCWPTVCYYYYVIGVPSYYYKSGKTGWEKFAQDLLNPMNCPALRGNLLMSRYFFWKLLTCLVLTSLTHRHPRKKESIRKINIIDHYFSFSLCFAWFNCLLEVWNFNKKWQKYRVLEKYGTQFKM